MHTQQYEPIPAIAVKISHIHNSTIVLVAKVVIQVFLWNGNRFSKQLLCSSFSNTETGKKTGQMIINWIIHHGVSERVSVYDDAEDDGLLLL